MNRKRNIQFPLSVLALTMLAQAPAWAQKAPGASDEEAGSSGGLAEIIVTASRRETNVQDVSIAISAVSGELLRQRGITDPRQLSGLAPNLSVDQGIGNGQTHVSIRGLASTSAALETSSPAAIYLDDVYQPFQFGIGTQIFDIGRIEVLRGPQGTLFGKNTTAGSINYYSQTPVQHDEGYLTLDGGGGDFNRYSVEGAFNKVVTSDLAMRASLRAEHRDPYINNLYDGSKLGEYTNFNGRLQLAWTPSNETKVNLKLFGQRNRGDSPVYISRGFYSDPCLISPSAYLCDINGQNPAPLSPDSRSAYQPINPQFENYDNYGATLKIDQSFSDYTLTSISNIQKGDYHLAGNDDGLLGDFFHSRQNSDAWQISQEFRLATPTSEPIRSIFGIYAQYSSITTVQGTVSSNVPIEEQYASLNNATSRNTTFAAFSSVTYEINKIVSLTGGARYTIEKVIANNYQSLENHNTILDENFIPISSINNRPIDDRFFDIDYALNNFVDGYDSYIIFNDRKTYKRLTWDAALNVKPSDDVLLYGKMGTGFRSGGFISQPANSGLPRFMALKPEKVTSYEVGFKTEWFDRMLRLNGDVYLTDYKDMQVQTYNPLGSGLIFSNAGSSRIKGIELELEVAPVDGLLLSGSLGYNDTSYRYFITRDAQGNLISYAGNALPYAAKLTGNAAISYETPVSEKHKVSINTYWSYRSRMYFEPDNNPIKSDGPRVIGNARIGYGAIDGKWEIAAYVNNILNQDPRVFSYLLTAHAPTIYGPKRTFGGQVTFRF